MEVIVAVAIAIGLFDIAILSLILASLSSENTRPSNPSECIQHIKSGGKKNDLTKTRIRASRNTDVEILQ